MRIPRLAPSSHTPIRAALRAVDARVRPDFRRAVACAALAVVLDTVTHAVGGVHAAALHDRVIAFAGVVAVVVLGVAATRSAAQEVTRVGLHRAGPSAATPLRVATLLMGYLVVGLTTLDLLAVPIGRLLVGGAVTGVILGIAAQQSLSNVFAGLVLLFARPYVPGEAIRVRAGSLGGPLDGTVTVVGLLYTTIETPDGPVNIPNGTLLAAAVGPLPAARGDAPAEADEVAAEATPGPGAPSGHPAEAGRAADPAPGRHHGPEDTRRLPAVPAAAPAAQRRRAQQTASASSAWSSSTITRAADRPAPRTTSAWDASADATRPGSDSAAVEGGVAGWADAHAPTDADDQTHEMPAARP